MLRILPSLGVLWGLLPADSDPAAEHGISVGAASAEGGTEWISSGEGLSLGRKQASTSGKEKVLTFIRAHESLNLPNVFLVAQLTPLAKPGRNMKRVPCVRDHLVTASQRGVVIIGVCCNAKHTLWTKWYPGRGWLNKR